MNQIHYKDDFVCIEKDLARSFVYLYHFANADKDYQALEYKQVMGLFGKLVDAHKLRFSLLDLSRSTFIISPELQLWTVETISPLTVSLEKSAVVLSTDLFSQFSFEQTIDEASQSFSMEHIRYFNDLLQAQKWLFEQ